MTPRHCGPCCGILVTDLVRTPFKIIVNICVPETAIASCGVFGEGRLRQTGDGTKLDETPVSGASRFQQRIPVRVCRSHRDQSRDRCWWGPRLLHGNPYLFKAPNKLSLGAELRLALVVIGRRRCLSGSLRQRQCFTSDIGARCTVTRTVVGPPSPLLPGRGCGRSCQTPNIHNMQCAAEWLQPHRISAHGLRRLSRTSSKLCPRRTLCTPQPDYAASLIIDL